MTKIDEKASAKADAKARTITITAKRDGFRRCGVAHGAEPTGHAVDAFTPAQWVWIAGDPMLVVNGELPAVPKGAKE